MELELDIDIEYESRKDKFIIDEPSEDSLDTKYLSAVEKFRDFKIYFYSRTCSQLSQVVQEINELYLKRTLELLHLHLDKIIV